MKPALAGRILFGGAAVLFGVLALMWRDADTWQSLHRILSLPFGTLAGEVLMAALIVGGIGVMLPRAARAASLLLAMLYALFALVCIPGVVAAPRVYAEYDGFFEQFSLLCGAVALYAASGGGAALGRAARFGLGLSVVAFTVAQIVYLNVTVELVPTWIPPSQMFWAILTTAAFALAALSILVNRGTKLALPLLTLMLALFGLLVWVPRLIAQPHAHGNWSEFALNYLITGAVWMVSIRQSADSTSAYARSTTVSTSRERG